MWMHFATKWSFVSNKLPCNGTLICILCLAVSVSYYLKATLKLTSWNTICIGVSSSFKSSINGAAVTEIPGTTSFHKSSTAILEMAFVTGGKMVHKYNRARVVRGRHSTNSLLGCTVSYKILQETVYRCRYSKQRQVTL